MQHEEVADFVSTKVVEPCVSMSVRDPHIDEPCKTWLVSVFLLLHEVVSRLHQEHPAVEVDMGSLHATNFKSKSILARFNTYRNSNMSTTRSAGRGQTDQNKIAF